MFTVLPIVIIVVLVLAASLKVLNEYERGVIFRLGRVIGAKGPGLIVLIPVVDKMVKVSLRILTMDVPNQDVITRDNAVVRVDGVVFFQVLDAAKAAYEVANLEVAMIALVQTNIRTVIGSMDLDESLSQRETINAKLLGVVDHATSPWGVKVNRIEIKDIQPPRDLVDAMARQMKAERDKRASILEAEGKREAAYREAEARERLAEAEAKATELVSNAIAQGDVQAINYFIAQKYVEAFKELAMAPNQKFVLMPMEASGVIGSIAGIAELAKEALNKQQVAAPSRPPRVPGA